MRYLAFSPILTAATNITTTSGPVDMNQVFKMSAQVVITGTATGSMQLQVSDDHSTGAQLFQNQTFTNWSNLGAAVAITTAGATLVAATDMCYKALRAVYTDSSGGTASGTVTVQILCQAV